MNAAKKRSSLLTQSVQIKQTSLCQRTAVVPRVRSESAGSQHFVIENITPAS
jgi:hypothetical protein